MLLAGGSFDMRRIANDLVATVNLFSESAEGFS